MAAARPLFARILGVFALVSGICAAGFAAARPAAGAVDAAAEARAHAEVSFNAALGDLLSDAGPAADLAGTATVDVGLEITPTGGRRRVRVRCARARWRGVPLGALEFVATATNSATTQHITVRIDGPAIRLRLRATIVAQVDPLTRRLTLGWRQAAPLAIDVQVDLGKLSESLPLLAVAGKLRARWSGRKDAPLAVPAGRFDVAVAGLQWGGEPVGDVSLRGDLVGVGTTARLVVRDDKGALLDATGRIPVDVDLEKGHVGRRDDRPLRLKISAPRLTPTTLPAFWSAPAGVGFEAAAELDIRGPIDRLAATGRIRGWHRSGRDAKRPFEVTLKVGAREQDVRVAVAGGKLLELDLHTSMPLADMIRRGARAVGARCKGKLRVAMPLAAVAPYLPSSIADPVGVVRGEVSLAGTLGSPKLQGRLAVKGARLTVVELNRRLRGVAAAAVFAGRKVKIEGVRADSHPGLITGQGAIDFDMTPAGKERAPLWSARRTRAALAFVLKGVPIVQPDWPVGLMDSRVDIAVEAGAQDAKVAIAIREPRVKLTAEELDPARAIPTNRAVKLVDWRGNRQVKSSMLAGDGRLQLALRLVDPARIHGQGAELQVAGAVHVDRRGELVHVKGDLRVKPGGHFALFGTPFRVLRGEVGVAEGHLGRLAERGGGPGAGEAAPLEPVIELVARGSVIDTAIVVKVRGPLRRPELILASSPALPEYQLMTLMITGRVDTVDGRNGNVRRKVARLVRRYHNPGLKRAFYDKLGVDKLGFGFGSSIKNPIVTVGKQVNRRLYVETVYRHDAPPDRNEKEGHVEYRLSPGWTVDTVFGDAGEGSFGLFWANTFGGPPPPEPPGDEWLLGGHAARRQDADGDGITNAFDLCRHATEDVDGFRDHDGCPDPDDDDDGILDGRDKAPRQPETHNGYRDADGVPDTAPHRLWGLRTRLDPIPFSTGGARIPAAAGPRLRALVRVLELLPDVHVRIVGHSDEVGRERSNLRVSRRRAAAVRAFLMRAGVRAQRVEIAAVGSAQPLDTGTSDQARARNRRVGVEVFVPAYPSAAARSDSR